VHNHDDDVFAYWDAPQGITNAYKEGINGLVKVANRMGRGSSYEMIRAKTLYADHARKVASGLRACLGPVPTTGSPGRIEYGPHIPTLVDDSEAGELK
jgi:hypothetical protein